MQRYLTLANHTQDAKFRDSMLGEAASLWSEAGRWDRALEITNRIQNKESQVYQLMSLTNDLIEMGQPDQASTILSKAEAEINQLTATQKQKLMETPHPVFWDMADFYIALQQPQSALRLTQQMTQPPDRVIRDSELSGIVLHFAQAGDPDDAFQVWSLIPPDSKVKPEGIARIAFGYIEVGNFEQASKMIRMLNQNTPETANLKAFFNCSQQRSQ